MKIGIVGGSGVYALEGLKITGRKKLKTPYGDPSDAYLCGTLAGREVCFLPRHGQGHRILPSEINHRANIYGFKQLEVGCLLSVSAVGSLRESVRPRDIVLPDQYFDRTKRSLEHTFFGGGVVAHVGFGDPTCPALRQTLLEAGRAVIKNHPDKAVRKVRLHATGTYVNMEGPAFSTRAESKTYRKLGFDVIGMTSLGEAKLCREAGICYQAMALVTDYDCWRESDEAVTVEMIVGHMKANTALAARILHDVIPRLPVERPCSCAVALQGAIMTAHEKITPAMRRRLGVIAAGCLP